jgi:hypothetical protein
VPAPLVACSTCGMLFRFANAPLLPLYSQGRSGQTTDAAMGGDWRCKASSLCAVALESGASACQIARAKSADPIATPGPRRVAREPPGP